MKGGRHEWNPSARAALPSPPPGTAGLTLGGACSFYLESKDKIDPATVAVRHKQARWHTEMYGYVFAAAQVGVTHRIRRDVMLYPGYSPYLGRPPMVRNL